METPEDEKHVTVQDVVSDLERQLSALRVLPLSEEALAMALELDSNVFLVRKNMGPFSTEVDKALIALTGGIRHLIAANRSNLGIRSPYLEKAKSDATDAEVKEAERASSLPKKGRALTNFLPPKLAEALARVGTGFVVDTVSLLLFLLSLWLGDVLVARLWSVQDFFEGSAHPIPIRWIFDGGDIASVACYVIRSCLRMFGIIKDEGESKK